MTILLLMLGWLSFFLALIASAYVMIATRMTWRFTGSASPAGEFTPPVTILKPLCGLEPGLYENLRTFCEQDYPTYQVVFGVRDANDPALPLVHKLINELPMQDLTVVEDARVMGTNLKVSNLANMQTAAKHGILVIADADMRVTDQYLRTIVTPLADPAVGCTTCLYKGSAASANLASRLGALFINEWFLPSVLVALRFEALRYCFGATMVVRTEVLQRVGGFAALSSDLADDHLLGKRISAAGYQVVLAPYVVENQVYEADMAALLKHELRWARTIKAVRPGGYAFSVVTYVVAMAVLYFAVSGLSSTGLIMLVFALGLRFLLHRVVTRRLGMADACPLWLLGLRDLLCFGVWAASFCGSRVQWKSNRFTLESDGHLIQEGKHSL